jgi:hypothetical protein
LVLAKAKTAHAPGRLIFAELKSATGKLTREQHLWLSLLQHSVDHIETYCWRPNDFPAIVARLTRAPEEAP